jgi:hypothetical protein
VEIIDATSSRIWRGAVGELVQVTPGRWQPQPAGGQQQQQQQQQLSMQRQVKQEPGHEASTAADGKGKSRTAQLAQQDKGVTAPAGDQEEAETEEEEGNAEQQQQQGTHMQLRGKHKAAGHGSEPVNKRDVDHPRKNPSPQRTKAARAASKPAAASKAATRRKLQQLQPLVSNSWCILFVLASAGLLMQ